MAGQEKKAGPVSGSMLKMDLLREGHAFSFFQAMRLLKILLRPGPARIPGNVDPACSIRIRPALSLAFPPADIDRILETEHNRSLQYEVVANFLGLYGISSPLPTFYTEDLMHEAAEDESACRDFIDFINQRIFELFYDCCIKYRQSFQIIEAGSQQHVERVFCLMGIGDAALRESIPDPYQLIRYIGLLIQKPRSAMGLETILRDALDGIPVSIVPCIKRKAKIPGDQKLFLGSPDHCLGENTIVGEEILDRMGRFAIRIGPLASEAFQSFYPDAENYKQVRFLTDFYIVERLEYDIEVILSAGEAKTVCLGESDHARLGLNTWVFSGDRIGEMRKVYSSAAQEGSI